MTDELAARITELEQRANLTKERVTHLFDENDDLRDRIDELESERERLIFRIGKLESCLPTGDDDYATLSRDDKVSMVRAHIMERAYSQGGKAALDYNDVQWSVFEGEPSADHCYTLMALAAKEAGFSYQESKRPKQLRVNLDATNAEGDFSHANKTESEGGR